MSADPFSSTRQFRACARRTTSRVNAASVSGDMPFSRTWIRRSPRSSARSSRSRNASTPSACACVTPITSGNRERLQDRSVGRQDRPHGEFGQALPREALAFLRLRVAAPAHDAVEIQTHTRVLVVVRARDPRIGFLHVEPEFLVQFAREGDSDRLPRLDLAAGKLPPACVDLALGTLRQQERAVGTLDDGGGDLDPAPGPGRACAHLRRRAPRALSIARPA